MPPCKFTDFLWSNLLDSIQCFGKVGILQARYLHKIQASASENADS
mgnify:CR=1 FL=1